jgi:hypothetical protein
MPAGKKNCVYKNIESVSAKAAGVIKKRVTSALQIGTHFTRPQRKPRVLSTEAKKAKR